MSKKNQWPFVKKSQREHSLQSPQQKPLSKDLPSGKLYTSCSKLPLTLFLDCLFDGDLTVLIISGKATDEQLKHAWGLIFTEYCGLMQSDTYNQIFELTKDINILNAKIALIDQACIILEIHDQQPEIIKILKELGLHIGKKVNVSTLRSLAKRFFGELKVKEQDYEALMAVTPDVSRENFIEDLNALSKSEGYMLPDDITVARFCKLLVHYRKMAEKRYMKDSLKVA